MTLQKYVDGQMFDLTEEDLAQMEIARTEGVVETRNNFLIETDVWALSDRTMTAEQIAYRQALRDITDQDGFPTNITWPTKP